MYKKAKDDNKFRIFQTESLTSFQKLISERHENIKYKSRRIWKNMLLLYNKGVSQTVFVSKNIEISTCRTEVMNHIYIFFFTI